MSNSLVGTIPSFSFSVPQGIEFNNELASREEQLGAKKGEAGQWASCVRVIDPTTLSTTR